MPVRPISQLAAAWPTSVRCGDARAHDGLWFVIGGVHYAGCETGHGTCPFCDVMDLPSYSLAKSIVGGIGLMRGRTPLPRRFEGAGARPRAECATDDRWAGVTLGNALDMELVFIARVRTRWMKARMERKFSTSCHEHKIRFGCRKFAKIRSGDAAGVSHVRYVCAGHSDASFRDKTRIAHRRGQGSVGAAAQPRRVTRRTGTIGSRSPSRDTVSLCIATTS